MELVKILLTLERLRSRLKTVEIGLSLWFGAGAECAPRLFVGVSMRTGRGSFVKIPVKIRPSTMRNQT